MGKKYSQLPTATLPLNNADIVSIEQGGVTKQTTVEEVAKKNDNIPTADQRAALVGEGVPSAGNKFTTRTFVESLLVSVWKDRGSYDASSNLFPASGGSGSGGAIKAGDLWTISVAGTLGGKLMSVGDTIRALIDAPGQTASNWADLENNIGYVPVNRSTLGSGLSVAPNNSIKNGGTLTEDLNFDGAFDVGYGQNVLINNHRVSANQNVEYNASQQYRAKGGAALVNGIEIDSLGVEEQARHTTDNSEQGIIKLKIINESDAVQMQLTISKNDIVANNPIASKTLSLMAQALIDIAGITGADNDFIQKKSGVWVNRSINQVRDDINFRKYRRGGSRYISNNVNSQTTGTAALAANTLRAWPFIVEKAITFDQIISEVSTLIAATTYRFGIYTDDGDGYPNSLVANTDVQTYDSSATGVKTGTPASQVTLNPGLCWIATNSNGAPTLRGHAVGAIAPVLGFPVGLGSNQQGTCWTVALTYGALPANFPAGATVLANAACPGMYLRTV